MTLSSPKENFSTLAFYKGFILGTWFPSPFPLGGSRKQKNLHESKVLFLNLGLGLSYLPLPYSYICQAFLRFFSDQLRHPYMDLKKY